MADLLLKTTDITRHWNNIFKETNLWKKKYQPEFYISSCLGASLSYSYRSVKHCHFTLSGLRYIIVLLCWQSYVVSPSLNSVPSFVTFNKLLKFTLSVPSNSWQDPDWLNSVILVFHQISFKLCVEVLRQVM